MRNIFRHYWPFMKRYPYSMGVAIFGHTSAIALGSIATPLLYKRIIDIAEHAPSRTAAASEIMTTALLLGASVIIAQVFLRRIGIYATNKFESSVMRDLNVYVFEKVQRHSYTFFANEFAGSLVAKQGRFVSSFEQMADFLLFNILIGTVTLVSAIGVLFWVAPVLGMMFTVWACLFMVVVMYLLPAQKERNLARAAANSKLTGLFADAIGNILAIKAFGTGSNENKTFAEQAEKTHQARLVSWHGQNRISSIQSILSAGFQGVAIFVAVYLWTQGNITAGTIVLIQIYLVRAADSVWDLARSSIRFQSNLSDAEEMVAILDKPLDIDDPEIPEPVAITRGDIRFNGVTFAYDGNNTLLQDFSLHVHPGEKIGLVGHSGAGKTTVTKLLLRFLDIKKGSITIDGQDITKITQDDLRRSIGYVPQEPLLFHRSLKENIAYGKPGAPLDAIQDAARRAHATEFIERLPQGYDTLVGERGVKLSGGERQRIAIARAMLKDAPILVLDEATSSLDSVSEMHIQEALDEAMKGRTTLVIAHRLSTIKKMDRIIVFDKGTIVEEGTHDSLVSKGGIYSELWKEQSGGFIADEEEKLSTV